MVEKEKAIAPLLDALCDDLVNTRRDQLLAEVADDYGDRLALAKEFDAAFQIPTSSGNQVKPTLPLSEPRRAVWAQLPVTARLSIALCAAVLLIAAVASIVSQLRQDPNIVQKHPSTQSDIVTGTVPKR